MFQTLESRRLMASTLDIGYNYLNITGDSGANKISVSAGQVPTNVSPSGLLLKVKLDGTSFNLKPSTSEFRLSINAGAGNDTVELKGQGLFNFITTRSYEQNGTIYTYTVPSFSADVLGGNGNDKMTVGTDGGNVWIDAGAGNDKMFVAEVFSSYYNHPGVYGNTGNDSLWGSSADDQLYGGAGNDKLYGDDGEDYLAGEEGNDTIYGDAGNDRIDGGRGADLMNGGTGDDMFYEGAFDGTSYDYLTGKPTPTGIFYDDTGDKTGRDSINGNAGDDTVRYTFGYIAGSGSQAMMPSSVKNVEFSSSYVYDPMTDGGKG